MAEVTDRDRELASELNFGMAKADSYVRFWEEYVPAVLAAAREEERERCAKIADLYADVNIEAAGDTVLADHVLSGKGHAPDDFAKSQDLIIDGCIHSAMFHAAQNIAAKIRSGE